MRFSGPGVIQSNTFGHNHGGQSGSASGWGGGLYLTGGPVDVLSNTVEANLASYAYFGYGGGMALSNLAAGSLVAGNVITANEGSWALGWGYYGIGGGVYQEHGGPITWRDNRIVNNQGLADWADGGGWGGGVHLASTRAIFTGTHIIQGNFPGPWAGKGGGLYVVGANSVVTVSGATILSNTARGSTSNPALGGGVYLGAGRLTLRDSTVQGNSVFGSGVQNSGGGLCADGGELILERNLFRGNNVSQWWGNGTGGGIALESSVTATLNANRILTNSVSKQSGTGYGGGVYVDTTGAVRLTNDVIAANYARTGGAGLYAASKVQMIHDTVADNSGPGGLVAGAGSTLALTNTIVAGHTTGITTTGGAVIPVRTLFWANDDPGIVGTDPITGDPAFVDPAGWDYHIGSASAAHDEGVEAGVDDDIDGEARIDTPDIGADEYTGAPPCTPPTDSDFTWAPTQPQTGETVHFTATVGGGTSPFTYTWAFGDAEEGQGEQVAHTYTQSGALTVWLTVTNDCGQNVAAHPLTVTGVPFVPTYGVELTPTVRSVQADPGATVVYTHTLRNTGDVADTCTVTLTSTQGWATLESTDAVNLAPGATAIVSVIVDVPGDAAGMSDVTTLQATSWASPTVQAQAVDTTTVAADWKIYLPLVVRNR